MFFFRKSIIYIFIYKLYIPTSQKKFVIQFRSNVFFPSNFYDGPPFILDVSVFKCSRTWPDAPYTWESNPQYATNALTPTIIFIDQSTLNSRPKGLSNKVHFSYANYFRTGQRWLVEFIHKTSYLTGRCRGIWTLTTPDYETQCASKSGTLRANWNSGRSRSTGIGPPVTS